jgi:hypothetical protein
VLVKRDTPLTYSQIRKQKSFQRNMKTTKGLIPVEFVVAIILPVSPSNNKEH